MHAAARHSPAIGSASRTATLAAAAAPARAAPLAAGRSGETVTPEDGQRGQSGILLSNARTLRITTFVYE